MQVNDISMENTVHEHAVATLKAAKDRVLLVVSKPTQDASPFHTLSSGSTHVFAPVFMLCCCLHIFRFISTEVYDTVHILLFNNCIKFHSKICMHW